jgi:uncharacterized protein
MSEAWSQPMDIGALADEQADFELAIPLAELAGLRPQLRAPSGALRGHAHFGREGGFVRATLELSGSVQLTCQRCLRPMPWKIDSRARVALVAHDSQAGRVPQDLEPVRAPGGKITLRDLFEEELLLALPIVPRHSDERACAPAAAQGEASAVQRPFERLGELLKRGIQPSVAREDNSHGRTKKS